MYTFTKCPLKQVRVVIIGQGLITKKIIVMIII